MTDAPRMTSCQRWRERRSSMREAPELFNPHGFTVDALEERPAKAFVVAHHYAGSMPAARVRVGLFDGARLVGVAVFSEPAQQATGARWAPGATDSTVLGRLVLLDEVAANGETWFLARAFRVLRRERPTIEAVVSYSDPLPRATLNGETVLIGHVGAVYQAFGGCYLGRSAKETHILDPAGRVMSRRSLSKIRNEERGAGGAYNALRAAGAPARLPLEDGPTYIARALREGPFRRVRHPGNHVYAWPIVKGVALARAVTPYPKKAP